MKIVIKTFIGFLTLTVGWILGITLLTEPILWKMLVFAVTCHIIGQLVYRLLRVIDRVFTD